MTEFTELVFTIIPSWLLGALCLIRGLVYLYKRYCCSHRSVSVVSKTTKTRWLIKSANWILLSAAFILMEANPDARGFVRLSFFFFLISEIGNDYQFIYMMVNEARKRLIGIFL